MENYKRQKTGNHFRALVKHRNRQVQVRIQEYSFEGLLLGLYVIYD
jgi:hypothetical protein